MGYKLGLVLVLLHLRSGVVSAATDKVICYHGSWSEYRSGNGYFGVSSIDTSLCTHVIYTFIGIDSTGTITILDSNLEVDKGNLAAFVSLKEQNSNLKVLVAVGGWNEGSSKYSTMAADSTLRANFISSALSFVQTYGFDGLDIDWEYPAKRGGADADVANFVTLLKELREVWDENGLILSAAVSATPSSVDTSYDVPSVSQYLDFINVMAYDLHGSWDGVTGQNAPLYASAAIDTTTTSQELNVNATIQGWLERGADPQKLVLGLGMYGRTFTLSDSSNTALGAAASGAGTAGPYTQTSGSLGYLEICEKFADGGWTVVWDDEQKNPYAYNGDQWIGYDNEKSITLKVEYATSLNLAGVMLWSIETDDYLGLCGTKFGLLSAINSALSGTSSSDDASDSSSSSNSTDNSSSNSNSTDGSSASSSSTDTDNSSSSNSTDTDNSSSSSNSTNTDSSDSSSSDSDSSSSSSDSTVTCTKIGYIRDPTDCNVFYYCLLVGSTYVPVKQQCYVGLYFDESAQACNYASLVSC